MHYAFVATALALPLAATAQAGDLLGLSFRVGPSYPTDSDTRDYTNDVGYNAGVRLEVPLPGVLSSLVGSTPAIDLEGFQAKDGSDKINYLGLSYLEQVRFGALGVITPYAGLGVGVYRVGVSNARTIATTVDLGSSNFVTTYNTVGGKDWAYRAGGRAMVGVELPLGLFTELSAVVIGKVNGVNPSTVNLAVGIRF
jgi:hypothetical protein